MPSVRTLSELFRALGVHDVRAAAAVAARIADEEERSGHRSAASQLRGALSARGNGNSSPAWQLDVATALIAERPGPPLSDVVLTDKARTDISTICAEWEHRDALDRENLTPRRKLVFSGPPGCGKTLMARSLGAELGMPVWTVRLSTLVGSYLGQTGANLRAIFAFAEATPCVLLLDEFDAIARTRGRATDVGELDRIVISLLQELDHTIPKGIVIAATNTPGAIDTAIWRRFDASIVFPLPTRPALQRFVAERLRGVNGIRKRAALPQSVKSFADAENWVIDLRRRHVIETMRAGNAVKTRA